MNIRLLQVCLWFSFQFVFLNTNHNLICFLISNLAFLPQKEIHLVCLFVCFNGRPGEANWYCNPEKRASRLASRTKSSCRDITHIQNNFMISSRLCSCTSLPGKGGGTWEGKIITEGGRSCKTHKCQNQLLSRSDGLRICWYMYLGTIILTFCYYCK